jgi:hypothetical protein
MHTASGQRIRVVVFRPLIFSVALASGLSLAGVADARKLGSVAPPHDGGCTNCETFQRASAAGSPSYRVPHGKWTITSWSTQGGGSEVGSAQLLVFRPTDTPGQYKLIGESIVQKKIPANGHPNFQTDIDVRVGDLLGIRVDFGLVAGYTNPALPGDVTTNVSCHPDIGDLVGVGTSCALADLPAHRVNAKAILTKQ